MRRFALIAACLLTLAASPHGVRAAGPEPTPPATAQAEAVVEKIKLEKADPNWLLRILFYANPTPTVDSPQGGTLDSKRVLAAQGVQAVQSYPLDHSLVVRGTPAGIQQFKTTLRLLDVSQEEVDGRQRVTLTPQNARPELVRNVVLELPEGGKAEVDGKTVKLEGSPAWIRRALRIAVHLETGAVR